MDVNAKSGLIRTITHHYVVNLCLGYV